MVNFKRLACLGLGLLSVLYAPATLDAGLFGKKVFKGFSKNSENISFVESGTGVKVDLSESWFLNMPSDVAGPVWLGTTYREVPYTEYEFNKLREEKINKELDRLKKDHIKKAKAEASKEGGAAVDDLLSDLLKVRVKKSKKKM